MATEGKERVLSTSVRRGCRDRAPQTGGLQTTGPFPAAVEPKKSKTKMLALSGGGLLCPDRGRWEGPLQLLSGHRSHSRWLRPRDLITRPKLSLPTLSPLGARISHMNCGGCKHSDRSRGASLTWDPRNRRTGKCISGQWGGRAHPEGQARVFAAALRQAACCVSCPGQGELLTGWEPGGGGWGLRVGAGLLSCSRFESLTLSCHKRSLDL